MQIDFSKLNFEFFEKPLLVGGMAMEYYGLRETGKDIDLVVVGEDYLRLAQKYPESMRNLSGDLGVCVHGFEIWRWICMFDYGFLSRNAIEEENVKVIHLEKLLFMKTLGISKEKYERDVKLIVQKVFDIQYGKDKDYKPDFLLQ